MKIESCIASGVLVVALVAANPAFSASIIPPRPAAAQMVITALPASGGQARSLEPADVTVMHGQTPMPVLGLDRLSGDLADMQLYILFDDSTRTSSLGIQLPELKKFIQSLPSTTEVAVGYMRNGSVAPAQLFTTDHQKAARALRLPMAVPGENGSPYFVLSDLTKNWPSDHSTGRKVVLMLTDGVDRYYSSFYTDDPYVDAAIHSALKNGVMVYSIYLRGAGLYGRSGWVTNMSQSRLLEVSEKTGGYAYFQGFTNPVSVSPFLNDLRNRLADQYLVTVQGSSEKGILPVKVHTELPGVKIDAPTDIYVP